MPRATRARAARGALKEKLAADANVPAVQGVLAAKAVDGIARGAADGEAAGTMFDLENELRSMDIEGTHRVYRVMRVRIDVPRASPPAPPWKRAHCAATPVVVSRTRGTDDVPPSPPAVERRCAQLHEAAETFAARLPKTLRAQLTKVPKKVRGMTLRAFLAQHGEDVRASLAGTLREQTRVDGDDGGAAAPAETSAEKVRKRGRAATAAAAMLDAAGGIGGGLGAAGAPPCTPADRGVGCGGGLTVARTPGTTRGPRRGEILYSRNGSPLGAAEDGDGSDDDRETSRAPELGSCVKRVTMTSHKRRRLGPDTSGPAGDDDAPGLVLTTDDGKEIDVAAVPADGAEVEETMGMLAKMQAQVAAHMARLMAGRR